MNKDKRNRLCLHTYFPLCCSCLAQILKDLYNFYLLIYWQIQLLTRGQIPLECRFLNYIFIPNKKQLEGFLYHYLFFQRMWTILFMDILNVEMNKLMTATEEWFIYYSQLLWLNFHYIFNLQNFDTMKCTPNFGNWHQLIINWYLH